MISSAPLRDIAADDAPGGRSLSQPARRWVFIPVERIIRRRASHGYHADMGASAPWQQIPNPEINNRRT